MIIRKISLFSMLILIILVLGCDGYTGNVVQSNSSEIIILESDNDLPLDFCTEKKLDHNIIMLESQYCGHCKIAKPILKEIAEERNVEITFLDVSQNEDRKIMEDFGLNVKYTPTLVIGCKIIIGGKSKEEYSKIIDEFLKRDS